MTDRRSRPIVRCIVPSCVSVGPWQSSKGRCPAHYNALVADTAAAIARARERALNPAETRSTEPPERRMK